MNPAFLFALLLPICSGIISCRIACKRCREKLEHPEMLEVYCAMCDECNERRSERLEGAQTPLRVEGGDIEHYLTNDDQLNSQDDCLTAPVDEICDEPSQLLTQKITTTSTTTTTTTTTRKPCPPRPCMKTAKAPCLSIPCALPLAMPVCPMCPMQMMGSFPTIAPSIISERLSESSPKKLAGTSSGASELYFYVGVPKKLLKQLQLAQS